jgi:hypothetical protein
MAHCPVELLDDLGDILAEVRGWTGVKNTAPASSMCAVSRFSIFTCSRAGAAVATSREAAAG